MVVVVTSRTELLPLLLYAFAGQLMFVVARALAAAVGDDLERDVAAALAMVWRAAVLPVLST